MKLTDAQRNRSEIISDIIRQNRRERPAIAFAKGWMPYQINAYLDRSEWHHIGDLRPILEQHIDRIDRGYRPPRHCCDAYTKTFTPEPGESMAEYVDRVLAVTL